MQDKKKLVRNVDCFGGDDVTVGWLNCQHFRALLLSHSVEVTILYMSSSTLKTEALVLSKRLVTTYEATVCHIPDNNIHKLHSHAYLRRKPDFYAQRCMMPKNAFKNSVHS